jgi:PLD-like domain
VTKAAKREFLAADAYPHWRRRVKAAEESVRVYSPYLDDLVVRLLGNSELDAEDLSVVTDLSPESGTLTYRRQLLAIRRLLSQDVEVRSLPGLHAKVLLVDGKSVTVGSQNFTSYARKSKETTAVPALDMSESRLVDTLERWYDVAEPVDLDLIEQLLDDLAEPFETARAAIEALSTAYDEALADYSEKQRRAAKRRFERDLAQARSSSASAGIQRAASASPYSAGSTVAFARLEWIDAGYWTLMRSNPYVDLTHWWMSDDAGLHLDTVELAPLDFYPVLLGPGMQMAFVRVGRSRITYVWRGVRRSAAQTIGGLRIYPTTSFPDSQADGSNLVITFGWHAGDDEGYQIRLRFDGERVLPVAEGALVGDPWRGDVLADLVGQAYDDQEAWDDVLRYVFSPVHPHDFREEKNAESFFPLHEWLRIDHTKFLGKSVLLIQPHR